MQVTRVSDRHATASDHESDAPRLTMTESPQPVNRSLPTTPLGRKRMIHRIRVSLVCLALCLMTFASQAHAQFFGESSGTASLSDYAVQDDFGGAYMLGNDGGTYLLFQKMIGEGTGFTAGYQRLGLRLKLIDTGDSHLWSEGHVIITDESRTGFNLGGGYRWMIDGNILGVHGWYDNFQTDLNNRYTQTTFGVELLHEDLDIRANAYIPFGDDENFVGIADEGTVPIFDKRRIAFIGTAFEEQAMKGVDAEVGAPILHLPWARAYAGGYYYESQDGDDAPGFRGRVETAISDDLSLNFMVTHDSVFDTNLNLGVEYRFSGGVAAPTCGPFHGYNRKYAQVRRQWPIATRIATVAALYDSINPRTGLPYKVTHVDNTNPTSGDGTFENPFRRLPSTAPGSDFVLVQSGVGETRGNINLDPFTRMLGEGKPFTFVDARRGEFLLPEAFGRTGPAPILRPTNPMRDVITIASGVEVNNFTIRAPGQTAIGGRDITDFRIEMINGNAENGINIVNASGRGIIRGFGMPGDPFLLTDTGIFVSNTGGDPLHLDVDGVDTSGGDVGMEIIAAGGDIRSDIRRVRGDNHMEAGMILGALVSSEHVAELDDVFIRSSLNETGRGIVLDVANGGALAARMNLVGADGNGDLLAADVTSGMLNATINNGFFSNSRTANGVKFTLDDARGRTTFNSLIADRNDVDGLNAEATGALNDYTINVIDSEVIANGDDNFDTTVTGGAALRLFVDPTLAILSQSGSGFEFEVRDPGSVLIADFIDTNLSQNALHAVDGTVQNGGYANVGMLRSLGQDSGANGLNLNVDRNATFRGFFDTGSFSRSGVNGVEVAVADGSMAELNFFNTPADQNGANGLLFDVSDGINGGSSLTMNVMNGDFSDNPLANVRGSVDGPGSEAILNFTNTTASNLGTIGGLVLDATRGGSIDTNWNLGSISNVLNDGVQANVDGPGSNISLDLVGLTIQNNLGDGIDGVLTNGGPGSALDINLTSTTVQLNAANGVDVSVDGMGATSRVNFVNSPVIQNVGDGFEFDVLGGANLVAVASGAGSFSGNSQRAWHGTVDGMGSAASLNVSGIDGDFSGLEGGRFDVTGGGLFNLTMFDVNVTGSRLDGLLTNVEGPMSEANLRLESVRLRNNGSAGAGDGFRVNASEGATVLSELDSMLVTGNRDNGFRFDTITGAVSNAYLMMPSTTGNGRAGLRFNTMSGGRSGISVTDGSFSNNGVSFPASGVEGMVRGIGSTANVAFNGTTADMNSRHGFDFLADTGARLTAKLVSIGVTGAAPFVSNTASGPLSASNNTLSGVRFSAMNGGPTHGNLLMLGANQFNNNGDYGVDYDALNIEQGIAIFDGSASNNGMDGVNIRMENVTLGSIGVLGSSAVASDNGGDGFDASVVNTTLGPINVGPFNTPTGVIDLLPGLSVNGITAENNMGHGIVFQGVNSTIVDGEVINNIANENQGNGLFVMLTDTMADNLHVNTNNASENVLNGVNVELLRTPINNLQMNDNGTLLTGTQNVGLTYFIDGDTFSLPFSISNSSDPGVDITRFNFDMSTSVSGALYNTVSGANRPFLPLAGSDVTTGLTTVNGTAVPPYPDGLVADFSQTLDLEFNDFNANETFLWEIDADLTPGGDESVFGNQLIGSTVVVDFSNGAQLTGALMAVPGNNDAAIFVATGGTGLGGAVANNGLNGIRLFADDSALNNLSASGNVSMGNGQSGMLIDTINGSDVSTAALTGNELTMNGNGGLVLDFDDSSLTDATISDSNLSSNTGDGALFDFMNSPVMNLEISDNPNIDQNTGNGINFQMVNSNVNGLLMDNNGVGTIIPPSPTGAFDITLNLQPGLTPSQIAAFQMAEQRWEEIIIGDVPDIGMIDDLVIDASVVAIDGPGGILGQAGPTGLRGGSFIPFQGIMQFDSADLGALEMAGQLEDVILHEMGHVLGFGTIWDNLGLLINPASMGGMDPRFTGAQATAQYNTVFGNMDADIPVEATGGPGTADSHWREADFTNELMTGFLNPGVNPISLVTIAQFEDLGYTVDIGQADPFVPLVSPPGGPAIEGSFSQDLVKQVVQFSDAASSGIAALQIGSKGFEALQAIQQNGLNGVNISLTNSDLTGGVISNNTISGHTNGDGVRMVNPTTTGTPIELDFLDNTISNNLGGAGVNIQLAQPDLVSTFDGNNVNDNGAQGLNLVIDNVQVDMSITDNTITGNGSEGINVDLTGTGVFNTPDFSGNTISGNGGPGVALTAADSTMFDLNLGVGGGTNTINGNTDAGLAIEMSDTASGVLNVTNTTITNTVDGSLADFNGDGLGVRMINAATLAVTIDGDPMNPPVGNTLGAPAGSNVSISGNLGDGVSFFLDESASLTNLDILSSLIAGNAGDGVEVMRQGMAVLSPVLMSNNDIVSNAGNGLRINARNAMLIDEYDITQNNISSNGMNGAFFLTEADARVNADISFNTIDGNGGDGIRSEGIENDPTDVQAIAGDWFGNSLSNNDGRGIGLFTQHGTFDLHNIGFDGVDGFGRSMGNVINANGLDGVEIGGNDQTVFAGVSGIASIVNNMITNNGTLGTEFDNSGIDVNTPNGFEILLIDNNTISGNSGNGMELSNRSELTGPGTNFLTVTADNNTITGNGEDGVEITTSGNNDGEDGRQRSDIEITNSTISMNGARGVDIVNRGDGDSFNRARLVIDNTTISANALEAVYVVNTADIAQTADVPSTDPLLSGGNVFNNPILDLVVNDSTITNNGVASPFSGTGLVVRVGTSGATTDHTDPGGFVSDGLGGLTGRGGVLGTVTDNTFGGNFGVDALFESFTSTVDPTTGTTWDAVTFDPTGYQSDPLGRFDLTFTGNTGDSTDVTNEGAFYANADPVFKSRDTAQAPAGPFDVGGARRRNAQRLADRAGAFIAPLVSPDLGTFLYPGVGASTFRVSAGSNTAGFTGVGSDSFLDAVFLPGAIFGELPFTWGTF